MTALKFTLKNPARQRIDVSPLTPDTLLNKDMGEIGGLMLLNGNREVRVDELFSLEGSDLAHIIFAGATAKLDFIGKGMTQGEIKVEGDAGSYLGMHMKGGRITVQGSVDAYGACEMRGGHILVEGNAGDFLGACLPGNRKGMAGGVVLVRGDVGDRVGDHMRRGAILVEGNTGDYLGSRMTAGTIAVMGVVGRHVGFAMGRGTLLLLQAPAEIPPTFNDCGTHTLGFIPLLLKGFAEYNTPLSDLGDALKRVRRYAGDMCSLGKGEILIPEKG